jgi:hypothetical protein
MWTLLLVLLAGCAPKGPAERSDDSGSQNVPVDDTSTGGTDDSGKPECTPVDYYVDADHDGYGTGDLLSDCDPIDAADVGGDCDDTNADVHPGQEDGCNGVDDDCDLDFDEDGGETIPYYWDGDDDGYGTDTKMIESCGDVPEGFIAIGGDCDDTNAALHPGTIEDWTNGSDDNCDGVSETETPVEVIEATGNAWDAPTAGTPELRVLGVYTSGGVAGAIDVLHDVPETVVLVLASYDPVDWHVTETYPGTVQRIIVTGYSGGTTVSGPKGVPVDTYFGGMRWSASAYDWEDAETRALVAEAEAATGLELTSFHGTYSPASLTISPATEWMDVSVYPDCTKKVAGTAAGKPDVKALDPVACADVLLNAHICLTTAGTSVEAYGLETGHTCSTATFPSAIADSYTTAMAWSDEYVYTCVGKTGTLQRASLLTGTIEKSYVYCSGVAILEGQIYVRPTGFSWSASLYDTWEDVQCGSPFSTSLSTTLDSNIAIHDEILFSTAGVADQFSWQTMDGSSSGSVILEDYSDWIWGIDVTDDGWFAFLGRDGITWHDAADGRFMDSLGVPTSGERGLACTVL